MVEQQVAPNTNKAISMNQDAKIKQWNNQHAGIMLSGSFLSLYLNTISPLLVGAGISFLVYLIQNYNFLQQFKPIGGYANWVTGFRLLLLFLLAGLYQPEYSVFQLGLAVSIISLDGVDGYLARKFNQSSTFGGYFDMEVDAFFVAVLSHCFFLDGKLGWWIIIIGLLRYIYVVVLLFLQLQHKKEKSTRFAKTIAVLLFMSLCAVLFLPSFIYHPLLISAGALTVYSFGVSFFYLIKD